MADACRKAGTEVWAYCLMPNHVHMVMVPDHCDGLRAALAESHRRYTRHINLSHGWRGHLWQERFFSVPMSESHLYRAVRYAERNPVTADLCQRPEHWTWSSARAHFEARDDILVRVAPMLTRVTDWQTFLAQVDKTGVVGAKLEKHLRTGRPPDDPDFLDYVELMTGRRLRAQKPGPKTSRK